MINSLQELLTPHVGEIRKAATEGDANAKQVIALYNMYVRCPEVGSETFCRAYFEDWQKGRSNK